MNDSRGLAYLQLVLGLDPASSAGEIMARRREFLRPTDFVQAEIVASEVATADFRTRMLQELNVIRQNFWHLDQNELSQRLALLRSANHPDTAPAASRLSLVAEQREALLRLGNAPEVNHAFVKSLTEILVAPASQANRLREREHSSMRPDANPQYESAQISIQNTVDYIRVRHPEVFMLEEAWLLEVLDYKPLEETEYKSNNALLCVIAVVGIGATILACILVFYWMRV